MSRIYNHRAHHVVEIISTLIFDRHWSKTTFLALQMVKFSSLHDEGRSSCGLLPPVNVLRMVVLSSISGVESSSHGTTERERQWWYKSAVDGVGKQRNIGD